MYIFFFEKTLPTSLVLNTCVQQVFIRKATGMMISSE